MRFIKKVRKMNEFSYHDFIGFSIEILIMEF